MFHPIILNTFFIHKYTKSLDFLSKYYSKNTIYNTKKYAKKLYMTRPWHQKSEFCLLLYILLGLVDVFMHVQYACMYVCMHLCIL